jgi:hypothetical protein
MYAIDSWSELLSQIIISFIVSILLVYFVFSVKNIRTAIKQGICFTIDSLAFKYLNFYEFTIYVFLYFIYGIIKRIYKTYIERRDTTKGDRID